MRKPCRCSGCGKVGHRLPSCREVPGREGKSRCAGCKEWLPDEAFSIRNRTTGQLQRLCKECLRPYRRKWYRKHHEEQVARTLANREAKKALIRDLKSKPCVDCGQSYHWFVMDFDHRNGEKTKNVSRLLQEGVATEKLLAEIAKCDLVCSNCHRIRTWERLTVEERARIRDAVLEGHEKARSRGVVFGAKRKPPKP